MTTYSPLSEVLADGEWVRHGLVWHWEPNPDVDPVPEEETRTYRPHDLIACPTCHARMDERCRVGSRHADHSSRLVKRVCPCGGPIRPNEPMCGFCRAEMTRSAA